MIVRRLLFVLAFALSAAPALAANAGDLRVVKVLDGKAELSVPAEFTPMSEEMKRVKYPSASPPKEIYTDERGTVNVAMKTVARPEGASLDALVTVMAGGVDRVRNITWHDKGKRTINGREFAYLEFTAKALDTDIYNYIYFTLAGDEMLMFTFNSTVEKLPQWKPTIGKIVASTRIIAAP